MSSAHVCVGRVGALAVALGIGSAIAALPTVASADTSVDSASPGSAQRHGAPARGPRAATAATVAPRVVASTPPQD